MPRPAPRRHRWLAAIMPAPPASSSWAGACRHALALELEPDRPPTASAVFAAADGALHLAVAEGASLTWHVAPAAGGGAAAEHSLAGHDERVRALAFVELSGAPPGSRALSPAHPRRCAELHNARTQAAAARAGWCCWPRARARPSCSGSRPQAPGRVAASACWLVVLRCPTRSRTSRWCESTHNNTCRTKEMINPV